MSAPAASPAAVTDDDVAAALVGAGDDAPKKFRNAATKVKTRNPHVMNVLFIRHAESSNNVLAEVISREFGSNPYAPGSGGEVLAEYDRRRMQDPDLSELGQKQAKLLPIHPHLIEIGFERLAAEGRVQIVTSPMQRAILTSLPLLHSVQPHLRATLVADVCEKGGNYSYLPDPQTGVRRNEANAGMTRAELQAKWGDTHDASGLNEGGWWACPCPGAEDESAFQSRLARAEAWLMDLVGRYATSPSQPDYLFIVSHADFIDAMLTKLLRLPTPHPKYVFFSGNTSISHVEFETHPNTNPQMRVRTTNSKPVDVASHSWPTNTFMP